MLIEEGRINGDTTTTDITKKKGGWITFPFILGSVSGLTLVAGGWYANIIVYAIQQYNIDPITSAQIHNVAAGGYNFFPLVAAIIADSFFGSYWLILVSAFISLLGAIMFTLSAALPQLRPPLCDPSTLLCKTASSPQTAFLYLTLTLAVIGLGGTRYLLGSLGANQFDKKEHQRVFFNWFIFSFEMGFVIAFTLIVYVQNNVSWAIGYGIVVVVNIFSIGLFLSGSPFYRRLIPRGSPFVSIGRVVVASFRNLNLSTQDHEYFSESTTSRAPTSGLRFFNNAALIKIVDTQSSVDPQKSWRLCSVEEVEDLKRMMKPLAIWGAGLLESTIYAVGSNLITVQALLMDRHVGPHFQIPAGTVYVFALIWTSFLLVILDRILYPLWDKIFCSSLTPLQRVGIGYFFNMAGMVAYAIIERQRLHLITTHNLLDQHNAVSPMSVIWLFLPLALLGTGSALYLPGEVEFYYREFPKSLRTTSTAMTSLRLAVGYYLSIVIVDIVRKRTSWLPNDINHGRLDKLYWLVSILGLVNFFIYLTASKLYKSNHNESDIDVSE
ncbi:protein NRT1/ PTR FAMILY 2.7-like [Silene latifolia]|uniref:protein NRT1/ PTR FAMILY 2.7-like n=1 Tax=Silene latifolia TaxID=37657 RepID=UPI003D77B616